MKRIKLTIEHELEIFEEQLEEITYLLKKNDGKMCLTRYVNPSDDDSCYIYFPINGDYQEGSIYIDLMGYGVKNRLLSIQVKDDWAYKWRR